MSATKLTAGERNSLYVKQVLLQGETVMLYYKEGTSQAYGTEGQSTCSLYAKLSDREIGRLALNIGGGYDLKAECLQQFIEQAYQPELKASRALRTPHGVIIEDGKAKLYTGIHRDDTFKEIFSRIGVLCEYKYMDGKTYIYLRATTAAKRKYASSI